MSTAILLFRRDLRLADHPAMQAALDSADHVLPLYIQDPEAEGDWTPGAASKWWLHHSLNALDTALRMRGSALVVLSGDTLTALRRAIATTDADTVQWSRCYEPAAIGRDKELTTALRKQGLSVGSHNSALMMEPWTLATNNGDPYRMFSPFARRFEAHWPGSNPSHEPEAIPWPDMANEMPRSKPAIDALELLPQTRWDAGFYEHWRPGESGAKARLEHFMTHTAGDYKRLRELPGVDGTSALSPHLHFGEISPRQCWAVAEAAKAQAGDEGLGPFQRELIWREFGHHLLYNYPHSAEQPLNTRFAHFPWRQPADYAQDLRAWQAGRTGVPIVDAGMRQLWHTGWMHNRMRMIVGSFLTKNLLIPWQEGARWFWDTLVDADLASNTLGWQWVGGSGADAAPYFRIFNPVLQAQKFDADGAYVRRWVPELATLPDKALHAPWEAKGLSDTGVRLGRDYPDAIVDLRASRNRALTAYEHVKG